MQELLGEAVTVEAHEWRSCWLKPWLCSFDTWRADGLLFEAVAVDARDTYFVTLIR